MRKKTATGILLMFLLTSIAMLTFGIQPVEATSTIYVRADGSIDPPSANITRDQYNITYTFTGNNYDALVIERDNITVDGAGYTLQTTSGNGISLSYRSNVTIKNLKIDAVTYGVYLYYSSNNTISNCSIYLSSTGITVDHSSYNNINGNNITRNNIGVDASSGLDYTTYNLIHNNTLVSNNDYGIYLGGLHSSVYWNNVTDNAVGISIIGDLHNVYGNNVTRNTRKNGEGITISSSLGANNVSSNHVAENNYGIFLQPGNSPSYTPNILKANVIVNNINLNFGILNYRANLAYLYNDVDVSNTVDGKPVYYWTDKEDDTVPSDAGFVVLVNCTNVTVENLTLERNLEGLLLVYSNNSTISGNNITNNGDLLFGGGGIVLYRSSNNSIHQNNMATNQWTGNGIVLDTYSASNTISENNLARNDLGIWFSWSDYNTFSKNKMKNNLKGILLDYSTNNTIHQNDIIGPGDYAIKINAKFNNISANNVIYNKRGIELTWDSNIIVENNIVENWETGVLVTGANNLFFHNNFVDNTQHVNLPFYNNFWDNGYLSGGNYWTDYEDKHPNATELDNSGMWNTSYVLNENNIDHYPLIAPTEPITRKFTAYDSLQVEICSNSSISEFQFNITTKKLSFNITGPTGTGGFCNVTIPENMLWGNFSLFINGFQLEEGVNYTKTYNGTHYIFHITYAHSEHIIEIVGTEIIPEFPTNLILPLFIATTLVAAIFYRKKQKPKLKPI